MSGVSAYIAVGIALLVLTITGCATQSNLPAIPTQSNEPPPTVITGKIINGEMKYEGPGLYCSIDKIKPRYEEYPEKKYFHLSVDVLNGYGETLVLKKPSPSPLLIAEGRSVTFDDSSGWGSGGYSITWPKDIDNTVALHPSKIIRSGENGRIQYFSQDDTPNKTQFEIKADFSSIDNHVKDLLQGKYKYIDVGFHTDIFGYFPKFNIWRRFTIHFTARFWVEDGKLKYKMRNGEIADQIETDNRSDLLQPTIAPVNE